MALETALLPTKTLPLIAPAARSITRQDQDRWYQHRAARRDDDRDDLMMTPRSPPKWPRVFPGL